MIAFLVVVGVLVVRVIAGVKRGAGLTVFITAAGCFVYVFCMWVPAELQAAGLLRSKIDEAGLVPLPSNGEIDGLAWRWSLELALVWLAERVAWSRSMPLRASVGYSGDRARALYRRAALYLIVIGTCATFLLPDVNLDDRGASGQGFFTLLRSCLLCGLSIIIFFRFYREKLYALILAGGALLLLVSGVRSPLLVLFAAFLVSAVVFGSIRRPRYVLGVLFSGLALSFVGALMSALRSNYTRNLGGSLEQVFSQVLGDSWISIYEAGIDTLDGYRLSMHLDGLVSPNPADLFNIVLTFVPRAMWPDKPVDFSVALSQQYLNYKSSGQFLSPVGYLSLVFGGYWLGLIGLFVIVGALGLMMRASGRRFWSVIIVTVAFRFFLGGSSFDLYYGLSLALPVAVALLVVQVSARKDPVIEKGGAALRL